jgi:hypothetical protein
MDYAIVFIVGSMCGGSVALLTLALLVAGRREAGDD